MKPVPVANAPVQEGLIIDPSTLGSEESGEDSRLYTRTAKIGIDATKSLGEVDRFEKVDVPPQVKQELARMLGIL